MARKQNIKYGKRFKTRKGHWGSYKYVKRGRKWVRVAFVGSKR